jgi:hypothetical protein
MQDQIETFGMLLIKGVIAPALTALIAWATVQVGAWIKAKVRNEKVGGVLDRLNQLAFHVVQEVQQTVVSSLPDKANKGALLAARDQAVATLRSHLGEKGLRELMIVFGLKSDDDAVKVLLSYVESAVMTMKSSNPPVTTTVLRQGQGDVPFTEKTVTVIQPGMPPADSVIVTTTQGTIP